MSIALTIEKVDGQNIGREIPIATNAMYIQYWEPIISKGNFPWFELLLSPGFEITEKELPEVLAEVRHLKTMVPQCYLPESVGYQYLEERLATLLTTLETLAGKRVNLFFG